MPDSIRTAFAAVCLLFVAFLVPVLATAQAPVASPAKPSWFDLVSIRGYAQVRYNRLFETNPDLGCEQCDRSWGGDGGFFIRRARIIFFGQISPRIYFYVQPDWASSAGSDRLHFAQLRDAYFDIALNEDHSARLRVGQSKVPYGFENMQSSQNRLPLDRNDALNSAVANERDLGVFFYWSPAEIRALFSDLIRSGRKGSGDYGVLGLGIYNGQTANQPEGNNTPHVAARLSYPWQFADQVVETGVQAYTGEFVLNSSNLSPGVKVRPDRAYLDERAAASLTWYPQPLGLQAEYNVGRGPEFNPVLDSIEVQGLRGGYVQLMYRHRWTAHELLPFARYSSYDGGKKHERDARSYTVREWELGAEFQMGKNLEIAAMYVISDRRYEDFARQDNRQRGSLLRLQAQVNF